MTKERRNQILKRLHPDANGGSHRYATLVERVVATYRRNVARFKRCVCGAVILSRHKRCGICSRPKGAKLALAASLIFCASLHASDFSNRIASVLISNSTPHASWPLKWVGSPDATGYRIFWRRVGDPQWGWLRTGLVSSLTLTNLVATNLYEAKITAFNAWWLESEPSNIAHFPPDVVYVYTADVVGFLSGQWTKLYELGRNTNYFGQGNQTNVFYRAAVRTERR